MANSRLGMADPWKTYADRTSSKIPLLGPRLDAAARAAAEEDGAGGPGVALSRAIICLLDTADAADDLSRVCRWYRRRGPQNEDRGYAIPNDRIRTDDAESLIQECQMSW